MGLAFSWTIKCPVEHYISPCTCNEETMEIECKDIQDSELNLRIQHGPSFLTETHFKKLLITNTKIRSLPANVMSRLSFDHIEVSGNELLSEIHPEAFKSSYGVAKVINLSGNDLHNDAPNEHGIFNLFNKFTQAEDILAHSNRFTSVPAGAFNSLKNLRSIFLARNDISTIGDFAFASVPKLVKLGLDYNSIEKITKNAFSMYYRSSEVLDIGLSYNPLEEIEDGAFHHTNRPIRLDFEENKLTKIPESVFNVDHIEFIDFYGNPFECNCNLQWLKAKKDYFKERYTFISCDSDDVFEHEFNCN